MLTLRLLANAIAIFCITFSTTIFSSIGQTVPFEKITSSSKKLNIYSSDFIDFKNNTIMLTVNNHSIGSDLVTTHFSPADKSVKIYKTSVTDLLQILNPIKPIASATIAHNQLEIFAYVQFESFGPETGKSVLLRSEDGIQWQKVESFPEIYNTNSDLVIHTTNELTIICSNGYDESRKDICYFSYDHGVNWDVINKFGKSDTVAVSETRNP